MAAVMVALKVDVTVVCSVETKAVCWVVLMVDVLVAETAAQKAGEMAGPTVDWLADRFVAP